MGLIERMVRRSLDRRADLYEEPGPPLDPADCWHLNLTPKWERPEDMGKEDLAHRFDCPTCGSTMTPTEARALRAKK